MAIPQFSVVANSQVSPTTFDADINTMLGEVNPIIVAANALSVAMTAVAAGGAVSLQYTFSTTITDADPGAGTLRLDNATQNSATTIRADLLGNDTSDYSGVLALLDDSTSTNKGYITLRHATTPTKWLVFAVASLASPSGYKNVTVTCAASSAASPFTNGDSILLDFSPTGDAGSMTLGANVATFLSTPTIANLNAAVSDADLQVAMTAATQAEMEAGTETALRTMTPQRVKQAITALAPLTPEIVTPTNTSPADAATGQGETPTLTGSTFYSNYGATHAATQVRVHTTSDFTTPLYSSGDQAGSTSFTLPSGILSVSETYYWEMRYKNSRGTYSDWSTPTTFQTAAMFNSYIATPAATPAAFGDPFEGGFYSGMFWNELIQSSTSQNIATVSGDITFTVSSGVAYAYAGQVLEARSRANPANKIIGTVAGANLTALILTVTSVEGSGTCTDWSIMSKYRNITAPKSTESSSLAYKNANTDAPAACQTLTEGLKATLAMIAAGDATVYPAAWYCHNLTTGGKNDWHLPARDQRELEWRNLKPGIDNNSTTGRPDSAINYTNLGSFDDTDTLHGHNLNSSPVGAAYSTTVPAQVAAGKNFRTGESEEFAYGSYNYWSSSEYSTTAAWVQAWDSAAPGYQYNDGKTDANYVRAVRRSII